MPHTTIRCEVLRIKDSINHLPKTCFSENPRGNPALKQGQAEGDDRQDMADVRQVRAGRQQAMAGTGRGAEMVVRRSAEGHIGQKNGCENVKY